MTWESDAHERRREAIRAGDLSPVEPRTTHNPRAVPVDEVPPPVRRVDLDKLCGEARGRPPAKVRRAIVAQVPCDWCGAAVGETCHQRASKPPYRVIRVAPHDDRITAWWRLPRTRG